MQKLLLELGGPLVIAVVLLGIARMVRDLMERFRGRGTEEEEKDNAEAQSSLRSAEKDENNQG